MDSASHVKSSLRAQCLAARERLGPGYAKAASLAAAKHLLQVIPAAVSVVAGYRAVRGEIDIVEAMAELSERGHELCLPVVTAPRAPLVFRRWRIDHPLEIGQYGIEIPPAGEPELIPDAVIVPLVAFDAKGYRLGYGAGFYDATIHRLRQLQKNVHIVGVAFAAQQVDEVPAEAHDERLDVVVTEEGVVIVERGT